MFNTYKKLRGGHLAAAVAIVALITIPPSVTMYSYINQEPAPLGEAPPLPQQAWELDGRGVVVTDVTDSTVTYTLSSNDGSWDHKNSHTTDLQLFMHHAQVAKDQRLVVNKPEPDPLPGQLWEVEGYGTVWVSEINESFVTYTLTDRTSMKTVPLAQFKSYANVAKDKTWPAEHERVLREDRVRRSAAGG